MLHIGFMMMPRSAPAQKKISLSLYTSARQRDTRSLRLLDKILLEGTEEGTLLGWGLVSTVTELGGGIDPLEVDLLEGLAGGVGPHGLAESHDTLLDTRDGALDHDEVVLDLTVTDEATHSAIMLVAFKYTTGWLKTYGVMVFLETSNSVEALPSSAPEPTR